MSHFLFVRLLPDFKLQEFYDQKFHTYFFTSIIQQDTEKKASLKLPQKSNSRHPHSKDKSDFITSAVVPLLFSRGCSKHTVTVPAAANAPQFTRICSQLYNAQLCPKVSFKHHKKHSISTTIINPCKVFSLCCSSCTKVRVVLHILSRDCSNIPSCCKT